MSKFENIIYMCWYPQVLLLELPEERQFEPDMMSRDLV